MSDSVRPHSRQPTRLLCPWDSPGKNTRVGCHFLLQFMEVKRESEVAQPCLTPSDSMDCSLPGSSAHGTLQARVLEWGAIAFSLILSKMNGVIHTMPMSHGQTWYMQQALWQHMPPFKDRSEAHIRNSPFLEPQNKVVIISG